MQHTIETIYGSEYILEADRVESPRGSLKFYRDTGQDPILVAYFRAVTVVAYWQAGQVTRTTVGVTQPRELTINRPTGSSMPPHV